MHFELIKYFPDDIIAKIWSFININNKVFINKEHYIKHNKLIDNFISNGRYESYIRDIIRHDAAFVFQNLLHRNFYIFLNIDNYRYDDIIYGNYILFLLYFSNKNNSQKCSNLINLQLSLSGLKKKRCKNNRIKYNRWSN